MSQDVKFFNVCDHIVNKKVYHTAQCPRCYGKGYYLDVHFNDNGQSVLAAGNIKLQQETLKSIIDKKYDNQFNPIWGSRIHDLIGSKNLNINKSKLEVIVRETLSYLKHVQQNDNMEWEHMDNEEMLEYVESIDIITLKPTGYHIKVELSNKEGDTFIQAITL